jgi:hypothetical protein
MADRSLDGDGAALGNPFVQVDAVDVFQRDVQITVNFTGFIDGDDVFMFELCGGLRLGLEPLDQGGVFGPFFRQNLEGDDTVELGIIGQKHGPHAARANLFTDGILSQGFAGCIASGCGRRNALAAVAVCAGGRCHVANPHSPI